MENTNTVKQSKPRRVTYLGVPAEFIKIGSQGNGERVELVHWLARAVGQPVEWAAGTVTAMHAVGDPRKDSFRVFMKQRFDSIEQATAWAIEALS